MPYAMCPSCDDDIYLPRSPRLGEIVACPNCGARLEVVDVNPLELDWPLDDEDEEEEDEFLDDEEDEEE